MPACVEFGFPLAGFDTLRKTDTKEQTMHATQIIAFANQKGGVGKTTTAINLAAGLAERGQDILVIDFDPQANATSALGIEKQPGHSVYAALLGESTLQEEIIGTVVKRLDLIPSELDLAGAEVDIARQEHYLHCFQKALSPLLAKNHYDYIFIDCPPSLGILTSNALTAAHAMIIPVQCEYLALEGLSMITRMIEQLRAGGANPRANPGRHYHDHVRRPHPAVFASHGGSEEALWRARVRNVYPAHRSPERSAQFWPAHHAL